MSAGLGAVTTKEMLNDCGLPSGDALDVPASSKRFPDGAHYRIEIPSTEGPACLDAILEEADRLEVPILRVSQGSGSSLLTSDELSSFAAAARTAGIEVSMFARPCAGWMPSATARAPAGGAMSAACHGQDGLRQATDDIRRASEHGFRSVLIADLGLLAVFAELRRRGHLPSAIQAKVSVMFPIANAATARVLEEMGANTLNVVTDLSLAQLAAIRAAVDIPLDVYVEAPDSLGGFVRTFEVADIVRVAAPVYIKFGLANAPGLYPAGGHLEAAAVAQSRERVRRARLGIELLERSGLTATTSRAAVSDLAVPV